MLLRDPPHFERRAQWQRPRAVVQALGLQPGETVVDLGSARGYFTLMLANAVRPGGRVIAIDIDRQMMAELVATADKRGVTNVEGIVGLPPRKWTPGLCRERGVRLL